VLCCAEKWPLPAIVLLLGLLFRGVFAFHGSLFGEAVSLRMSPSDSLSNLAALIFIGRRFSVTH